MSLCLSSFCPVRIDAMRSTCVRIAYLRLVKATAVVPRTNNRVIFCNDIMNKSREIHSPVALCRQCCSVKRTLYVVFGLMLFTSGYDRDIFDCESMWWT